MYFLLQKYSRWAVFLVPSVVLTAYSSPSYAEITAQSDIVPESSEEGETTRSCAIALSVLSELPMRRPVDPACVNQGTTNRKPLQLRNSPKPVSPVSTETPAKPVSPVSTEAPAKPVSPVSTEAPAKPVSPVSTEAPAKPVSPVSTEAPAKPVSPVSTETPAKPVSPVSTEAPAKPVSPVSTETPAKPVSPVSTETPAKPVSPVSTETPAKPVSPVSTEAPAQPVLTENSSILVKKIALIDSSFANSKELDPIIKKVEGMMATLAELRKVADQITGWYFARGYITSVASVEESAIKDGIVPIKVNEGAIEEIKIDPPTKRINAEYVRSRIALGTGTPFSQTKLEEQLRLLQSDPLFKKVEASIRPGKTPGKSLLVVRVTEADSNDVVVSIDNYSPPSVGSERLGISAIERNLTGRGDQLAISHYLTTRNGGSKIYDLSYQIPLNPMNGTVQFRTAINQTKVVQPPFDILDIGGQSLLYEITYRQPLIRTLKEELALSLGFTVQDGQTFTFAGPTPFGIGPDLDGNSRTRTFKFAQDYVRRDRQGAWGARSQFNLGVGWLGATYNPEPKPDGRFFTWNFQLQRQQFIGKDHLLIAQADFQFAPNALLPSQQYVIGGAQSVRGFRQNIRAGDNGWRFSIEDRITVQRDADGKEILQIAPFFDMGETWNAQDNPNIIQKQRFIAGLGLGVLWKPIPNFNVRLDYALPLIELDDKGQNAQDSGFYFNASYGF